jgi:hypothetical protein
MGNQSRREASKAKMFLTCEPILLDTFISESIFSNTLLYETLFGQWQNTILKVDWS